jgi:dTDP-4-dehydrorhamnose reductase
MRIAVTGTGGRVGAALVRRFCERHEVVSLPRRDCDLAEPASLAAALDALQCDVFINPAGLTSLEDCENDPPAADRINARAPGEIARWAARRGVPVFHFSTDYVFSGELPGLRAEAESTAPLSVYGRSKLAGERAVLAFPGNCVVRVSWVFGPEKPSFVDAVFDDARAGRPLAAIADKFSRPTATGDLAGWLETLVEARATGIVHACNSGPPASWHDLATCVVRKMADCGCIDSAPEIARQKLAEISGFRAPRPRFTAMDTTRLAGFLGQPPRPWRDAVGEHVRARCRDR